MHKLNWEHIYFHFKGKLMRSVLSNNCFLFSSVSGKSVKVPIMIANGSNDIIYCRFDVLEGRSFKATNIKLIQPI